MAKAQRLFRGEDLSGGGWGIYHRVSRENRAWMGGLGRGLGLTTEKAELSRSMSTVGGVDRLVGCFHDETLNQASA